MQLTVENLRTAGGFTGGPVKRTVSWEFNGETVEAEVWVRPMSYQTAVKDIAAYRNGGDVIAYRIAACICHEDGSPVFQLSDITGFNEDGTPVMVKQDGEEVERGPLNKDLADALMMVVSEVSGLGKQKKPS